MEEKLLDLIGQSLEIRADVYDVDEHYITFHDFKPLPLPGDVLRYKGKDYKVVERVFCIDPQYSWDKETPYRIIVERLVYGGDGDDDE